MINLGESLSVSESESDRYHLDSLKEDTIYQPLRSGRIWHKVNF